MGHTRFLASTTAAFVALLAVSLTPASARALDGPTPATTSADCSTGNTCFYGDGGFSGWLEHSTGVQTTNVAYPNQMSSWINRNTHAAAWFTGANGTGTSHCMPPNIEVSQVTSTENDTMVSFKIYSGTSC